MIVVYDLEQLVNFHSCYAIDVKSGTHYYFELSDFNDDSKEYYEWLMNVDGMIGFNNLDYDYPLLHHFIKLYESGNKKFNQNLYPKSQEIIDAEYPAIKNPRIPQLDVYRICHFNNKAKATGLKDVQIMLRWHNVQDMPYKHYEKIDSVEKANSIKEYNRNDVESTLAFYKEIYDRVSLRKKLAKQYKIPCMNWDDSMIGEEIMIKECANINKVSPWSFKTSYKGEYIPIKQCFVHYQIVNEEIIEQKNKFAKLSLTNEQFKGSIKDRLVIDGFPFDFGSGGIHGCATSQYVIPKDDEKIKSSDVSSYYPNLAIQFGFYIKQFGMNFIKVLSNLYKIKQESKKNGDKISLKYVKLALVSIFGKSNSKFSKLFDPYYFLTTTIK